MRTGLRDVRQLQGLRQERQVARRLSASVVRDGGLARPTTVQHAVPEEGASVTYHLIYYASCYGEREVAVVGRHRDALAVAAYLRRHAVAYPLYIVRVRLHAPVEGA